MRRSSILNSISEKESEKPKNEGRRSLQEPVTPEPRSREMYGSISISGLYYTDDESPDLSLSASKPSASTPLVQPQNLLSDGSTLVNLVKGYLGTGYLALPVAFMYAGLWFGTIMLPIIAVICIHCLHLLLQSSQELCRRHNFPALNYEETALVAFHFGPSITKKMAVSVTNIIRFLLVITQIGFCSAYYQFVVRNINQLVECESGGTSITILGYSAILIIPVMAVSCLKDLKTITYLSVVSGVVQLMSIGIILYFCTKDLTTTHYNNLPSIGQFDQVPLFFGITFYSFEGIGLILLLENKMKNPDNFGGTFGLLNLGMSLISLMFLALAFFGYLNYGPETAGSITLNLPLESLLARIVIVCLTISVLLTFPLQLYVPVQVLVPLILSTDDTDKSVILKESFVRAILVFSTFSLCAAIPNIGAFVSFIGAFTSSTLSIIFPPLINLVTFHPNTGWRGKLVIVKAVVIVILGLLGFFTGTLASLREISSLIKEPNNSTTPRCNTTNDWNLNFLSK